MAATAAFNGYVKIGTSVIALLNSADLQSAAKQLETTALGGNGWDAFIMGTLGGKLACKGAYDQTDTNGQAIIQSNFFARTSIPTVVFSPDGVKTFTFAAFVLDYKPGATVNGLATLDFTLLPTGIVTPA
jgi:predicted secreted protein